MFENIRDRVRLVFVCAVTKFQKNRLLYLSGLIALAFAAGVVFWNFQKMGFSHWDEYYFVGTAEWDMNTFGGFFQADDPPLFPYLLSIMLRVFGLSDYVAVATSELMALLLCVLTFWWVRRGYGFSVAVASVLILASTPMFVYYAKIAITDMTFTFFFAAAVFAYEDAFKRRKDWVFLLAGLMLACSLGIKYNGFLPLLAASIFLPLSCLRVFSGNASIRKQVASYFRDVARCFPKLWLSLAPSFLFILIFLAYLGNPFPPSLEGFRQLILNFIPKLNIGLLYLVSTVYPNKSGELVAQPFVTAGFYGDALVEFVGLPLIILATIGAARGLVKQRRITALLIIWVLVVFVFFSSLPGTWSRVILPLIVPIAILGGQGTIFSASKLIRLLRALGVTLNRRRRFGILLKSGFVIAVVLLNLYSSIPAITNAHSAYREAAEYIAAKVPIGYLVDYFCQPVLVLYLNMFGAQFAAFSATTLLNQSFAVVLDFTVESSPDYLQIQTYVSKMTLATSIRNDVPAAYIFDWEHSVGIQRFESDPDRMNIRIYFQPSPSVSNSPSQLDPVSHVDSAKGLNRDLWRNLDLGYSSYKILFGLCETYVTSLLMLIVRAIQRIRDVPRFAIHRSATMCAL